MGAKSLRVYGCGGAGINLTVAYTGLESTEEYADILPAYVDTSRSNIDKQIPDEECFVLPDVDGSGKVRRENHAAISDSLKSLLTKFPAGDFNIVVFSGSGGSGSVIGPLVVRELLDVEASFIVIVVGSTESAITCDNTLNTLKSLDQISKNAGLPITLYYEGNDPETKRSTIDTRIRQTIARISALTSGNNRELDTRDISTWLYYNRYSKVEAQLSQLLIHEDPSEVEGTKEPISIASLMGDPDTPLPKSNPDYQCTGYHRSGEEINDMHFVISIGGVKRIYDNLASQRQSYSKAAEKRNLDRTDYVSSTDNVGNDGMVL